MTGPFEAAWHRIDRAEAHRKAAADVWNTWLEGEPYTFQVTHNGQGKHSLYVVQNEATPPEMAIRIGEWLYNLRCAIDYAVYAAAVCVTGVDRFPGHGQLEMPVCFTEAQYRENEYRLDPLTNFQRTEIIELMQPYGHADPDTSALGWLHKLARMDRHRRLHFMTAYAAEVDPIVRGIPPGTGRCKWTVKQRVITNYEAEIASLRVRPWDDSWKVQVNPQVGLDPEIAEWAESPFWRAISYNERLLMLTVVVKTIVVPLEYHCTGDSREAHALTDGFRAECDADRKKSEWVRRGLGTPSRDW